MQNYKSITHAHLVEVLRAELATRNLSPDDRVEVLDVGCGNGNLMSAIHRFVDPGTNRIRVRGFDVGDARVQRSDFFAGTVDTLRSDAPEVDWTERTDLITTTAAWPCDDESIDIAVSNQVLEHVADIDFFMSQLSRVLRPGGLSVNLFPVRSLVIEGHTGIPFGHRVSSTDVRRTYMTLVARLGLARLGPMRRVEGQTPAEFGATRSEYVATQTFYRSFRQLAEAAHAHGLTASYRWSPHFYALKLGDVFKRDVRGFYRASRLSRLTEFATFWALSRASSVTITFAKDGAYDPDAQFAGHLG